LTLAPQVVGAGDRKKKIVGPVAVNVYAIGMYVDPVGAKAAGAMVKQANKHLSAAEEGHTLLTLLLAAQYRSPTPSRPPRF
jgi:hypothetical protein